MRDAEIIERIREKYRAMLPELDERGRRRWAAVEARSLGWGGISAVAAATGMSDRTIRNGIRELQGPDPLPADRQRRPGAGRRSREEEQPGLITALEDLIEPATRGDPNAPLRWTCKSTRRLAEELQAQGFVVSATKVASLLKAQGYSLQSNRKRIEGKQHPDRNAQFEHIARRVKAQQRRGQPAISVDTKKKEPLGNMKNPGRTYRRKGDPVPVKCHDFPDPALGKAVPYGVYDLSCNEAGVSVGVGHDTAEFAVASIRRWWERMGHRRYGSVQRLLITADSGGSNSPRTRLWLWELQRLTDETGMILEVCHYPSGTSKWNKIEPRLFCHITRNWQGVPLETLEIVVNLIGSTRTGEGLEAHAWLDERKYAKGRKISDAELAEIHIKPNNFHAEWNYEIHPKPK
ncbi:MAG: ISAzo13 family transposase [Planctomycetes bacterium]|nr:ISAzo13 family transposase [Planctomycetota bacterium]